ncbi:MAG: hypothetical protein NXI31_04950 [bacterium]|nr:hypothetical protein [bacterium]
MFCRAISGVLAWILALAGAASQPVDPPAGAGHGGDEVRWLPRVAAGGLRLVGPEAVVIEPSDRAMPRAPVLHTVPGDYRLHFPADALGKPDSLAVVASPGASVSVAVEPAAPVRPVTLEAAGRRDYRIVGRAKAADSAGRWGLVARRRDEGNWYRFVWDREREQFRLERSIGGDVLVIRTAPAPAADGRPHDLALQVAGFRLHAWFDDELVLQALDGAHGDGEAAPWQFGSAVDWRAVRIESPVEPRASSALVRSGDEATFVAATTAAAGHHYVIELALDRPHALLPTTAAGFEPWVLQRVAAPRILLGDFSPALGDATLGELPVDGRLSCRLRLPRLRGLAGQVALVRALVITADGDRLAGRTPATATQI